MKKVLVISFFNSSNVGDKAIGEIVTRETARFASVLKMDISGKPEAPSVEKGTEILSPKKCRFYTLKSILALLRPKRMDFAKSMIKKSDYIFIAGGNMLMDMELFPYYSYLCDQYVRMAKKMGKKIAFVFIGAGKIRTSLQLNIWRHALKHSDFVSVRDSYAKDFIINKIRCHREISVWKDPVFLLENREKRLPSRTIGLNVYLNSVARKEDKKRLKSVYVYLIQELQKKYNVVIYTTEKNDNGDLEEIYAALSEKSRVRVEKPNMLLELIALYHALDMTIVTRMHAFIIAITQNLPAIILSWDRKIDGMIHDIGASDVAFDIYKAEDYKERILSLADNIMANDEQRLHTIGKLNLEIKDELKDYFEQLKNIVEAE